VKATEDVKRTSWTSRGDMESLLQSFKEFPDWCKRLFKHAPELGLWQLRDLGPLDSWTRGRAIIIGDASHAMLPTQGQGASQSIEDAVGVPITNKISGADIERNLLALSLPT
jgi:salicylate hydroxylase